jgi:hypothetical protein
MGVGLMTWGMRWDKDNAEAIMALAACTTPICGRTTGPNNVPHEPRQEYSSLTPLCLPKTPSHLILQHLRSLPGACLCRRIPAF